MSFPFNFNRNDEQFIDKVRTSKKREMDIARLEVMRAWCFWAMWLGMLCSTLAFILGCFIAPFNLLNFSSSLKQAMITSLTPLFVGRCANQNPETREALRAR